MKTYIAIADEDGANVLTTLEGTTCPRCGTPVEARKQHTCGDSIRSATLCRPARSTRIENRENAQSSNNLL